MNEAAETAARGDTGLFSQGLKRRLNNSARAWTRASGSSQKPCQDGAGADGQHHRACVLQVFQRALQPDPPLQPLAAPLARERRLGGIELGS